jgi:hypothetical protein
MYATNSTKPIPQMGKQIVSFFLCQFLVQSNFHRPPNQELNKLLHQYSLYVTIYSTDLISIFIGIELN